MTETDYTKLAESKAMELVGTGSSDINVLRLEAKAQQMLADQLRISPQAYKAVPSEMPAVWTSGNTQYTPGLNYTLKPRMLDESDYLREELANYRDEVTRYRKLAQDYKNQRDAAQAYRVDHYGREAKLIQDYAVAKMEAAKWETIASNHKREIEELKLKLAERDKELASFRTMMTDAAKLMSAPSFNSKGSKLSRAIGNMDNASAKMGLPINTRY